MNEKFGTLLVVDDEDMIREILVEEFATVAEKVIQARNGKEALTALEENPEIDGIFSDISMPEMDGLELLEWVSEHRPYVGMVMLSAYGDKKNTAKALKLGALDFIDKPFQIDKLVEIAKECLEFGKINHQAASEVERLVEEKVDLPEEKVGEWKRMKHKLLVLEYRKKRFKEQA
ncbi:MAG: response regulator [Bdellovibrionota bacterium]|nr:response regulator [Bdellovibrionota bacterium]